MIKTEAILDRLKKKRLKIQIFKHLFALAFHRGQGRLPKLRYCYVLFLDRCSAFFISPQMPRLHRGVLIPVQDSTKKRIILDFNKRYTIICLEKNHCLQHTQNRYQLYWF